MRAKFLSILQTKLTVFTACLVSVIGILQGCSPPHISIPGGGSHSTYTYTPRCTSMYPASSCYWSPTLAALPTITPVPPPRYPGCEGWDCRKIDVSVVYAIDAELGRRSLVVEAFDNPYFAGSPGNSAAPSPFIASFTNTATVSMWLKPGRWWFRAWLADDLPVAPLTWGNLQLVRDVPVGVSGALSGATAVDVQSVGTTTPGGRDANGNLNPPLLLVISNILVDPDSPGTAAYLRLMLTVAGCELSQTSACSARIPRDRDIIIRLLDSPDFADAPVREFKVSSNLLLVSGSEGRLEWFSPELLTGRYYVAAAVDADADGYFDETELVGMTQLRDVPIYADVRKNHTQSMAITLDDDMTVSE